MVDWSCGIPRDLLSSISRRLSLVDCIRFGAVCESWRSVIAERGYPPSKLPWLLLPKAEADDDGGDNFRFYSLSDKKEYKIRIPGFRCSKCIGASDGWLVIYRPRGQLMLLNPLTGSQIRLPSIPTIFYKGKGGKLSFWYLRGVVSWSSKSSFTVMVHSLSSFAFTRAGDKAWTRMELDGSDLDCPIHHKGLFYVETGDTEVVVSDLTGPGPRFTPVVGDWRYPQVLDIHLRNYLVESSGDLFLLMRKFASTGTETIGFEVSKLDPSGPKWTEVRTLGNYAFFLGNYPVMPIPAHELTGLKRSCIYFVDDESDMRVFDLEDGSIKTYHSPDPHLICSIPMWFMPNLL